MRRLRQRPFIRDLVRESVLSVQDLILPLFIIEGEDSCEAISAMPGCARLGTKAMLEHAQQAHDLGIPAVALFPVIEPGLKSAEGAEAFNPKGLVPRAVAALKKTLPDLGVITDVALDPYTNHGQDGIIDSGAQVMNDETLVVLQKQALAHARAGADVIAPSDMMDGRIGAIREALDSKGFQDRIILSYAAKYASNYYGPFRDALKSKQALAGGDKKGYQMDIANSDEALRECAMDISEGADIIMIKPGMPCLDVIYRVKTELNMPTFAYQVSGEYAMLQAAFAGGHLDRDAVILESLLAFKRAGADAVLSYFAIDAAKLLRQ
jgi:porphobilinogen synthase